MAKDRQQLSMKEQRGQFFTTLQPVQETMTSLIRHDTDASVLEPSAGRGDLVLAMERHGYHSIDAVEYDGSIGRICDTEIRTASFFDAFPVGTHDGTYDVVIGNPPYVAWKNLETAQQGDENVLAAKRGYSDKCNFYFLFIDRAIDLLAEHGEMVLIVPKEWLYSTSAKPLRDKMVRSGAITDIIDLNEERVFDDATPPAMMIFRYVRGQSQDGIRYRDGLVGKQGMKSLIRTQSHWLLVSEDLGRRLEDATPLGTLYIPRVGIVSGADGAYLVSDAGIAASAEANGWRGFSRYITTDGIKTFVDPTGYEWEELSEQARRHLKDHETELRARRIMRITDDNWFRYGAVRNRDAMLSDIERFYVRCRTRDAHPFFYDERYARDGVCLYSGGIIGLFRNDGLDSSITRDAIMEYLNSNTAADVFVAMGMTTGNKKTFMPSTLSELPVPAAIVSHD